VSACANRAFCKALYSDHDVQALDAVEAAGSYVLPDVLRALHLIHDGQTTGFQLQSAAKLPHCTEMVAMDARLVLAAQAEQLALLGALGLHDVQSGISSPHSFHLLPLRVHDEGRLSWYDPNIRSQKVPIASPWQYHSDEYVVVDLETGMVRFLRIQHQMLQLHVLAWVAAASPVLSHMLLLIV
jgi:hypothetical protein